jgi:hypothetical protein
MERMNRSMISALVAVLLCGFSVAVFAADPIPRTGLKLWITADSVQMTGTEVAKLIDLSGSNNSPTHSTDVQNITTVPSIVKVATKYNGHAVLHFPGTYTGFNFTRITGIRAVFAVLFKDSSSCKVNGAYETAGACCAISPKFWIGDIDGTTNFHADHGCCIFRNDFSECSPCVGRDGFVTINAGPKIAQPALTFMPFSLGVLSILASCGVQASVFGRDRTMTDRSFAGDIAEILIYTTVIDTSTAKTIANYLMGKYGINGKKPSGTKNDFSNQIEIAPTVSMTRTNQQTMKFALTGAGNYSLSIMNTQGRTMFRKSGASPDAIVIKKSDFPNGSYYLTGHIKNAVVHQNLAVIW